MINWDDLLSQIRADRQRGSAQLYQQTLAIIAKAVLDSAVTSRSDLGAIIQSVYQAQPAMAPFHFLAHKLESITAGPDDGITSRLIALIDELQRAAQLAGERVAANFERFNLTPRSIMLHSNSGTVRELIRQCFSPDTTIFLSEARPDLEGLLLAGDLVIEGYTVKTFVDDARAAVMKDIDLIILGADWVTESDFTNKIGTYSLALTARELGKPVYVAVDRTKFVARRSRVASIVPSAFAETFYQDQLFEETPNQLVAAFVTDFGIISPQQAAFQFETTGA